MRFGIPSPELREALPFAAGTFDVATATTVLCPVENPEIAPREMARVLKPGVH